MAGPPGLTQRALGRFAGRHLRDQAKLEFYAGRGVGGVAGLPVWTEIGLVNARYLEATGWTRTPQGIDQQYTSAVILQSLPVLADPNAKYRITVTEFKGTRERETDGPEPEIKRTRVLEVVSLSAYKDAGNNDTLQVARCVNGRQNEEE